MTDRCNNNKLILMGSGQTEEGTKETDTETVETGWVGGARISVKH